MSIYSLQQAVFTQIRKVREDTAIMEQRPKHELTGEEGRQVPGSHRLIFLLIPDTLVFYNNCICI